MRQAKDDGNFICLLLLVAVFLGEFPILQKPVFAGLKKTVAGIVQTGQ